MKKLIALVALFTTVYVSNVNAQDKPASDPAVMAEQAKEKMKPQLMEKAKLTDAEATKVLNIHFTYANRLAHFKNAPAEEQKKQAEIIHEAANKEYAAIPLTETQLKAVNGYFEQQKKQTKKSTKETSQVKTNQ